MKPHNLVEMLANTVKRLPDKTALMWKESGRYVDLSYSKLWETIQDFAFGLKSLNINPEAKVAILAGNSHKWLISDLAILSLGAVSVPIYATNTGKQIEFILNNADVEMLIVESPEMLARISNPPEHTKHFILMNGESTSSIKALNFESVLQMGRKRYETEKDWAYPAIQPHTLATIVHTSGTTNNPKGVMLSHHNILSTIEACSQTHPFNTNDLFLSILPTSHIYERAAGHFTPLYFGATIAYSEGPLKLLENLQEVKPTVLVAVPRLFEKIYSNIQNELRKSPLKAKLFNWALKISEERFHYTSKGFNWPVPKKLMIKHAFAHYLVFSKLQEKLGGRLRSTMSAGASLDRDICLFFTYIGIPAFEAYGMTESSTGILGNPVTNHKPGTVGVPFPGTEIRLMPDNELVARSSSVMMGYYKEPEETAKTIVNGWLHTGDIAEIDEEGYVKIVDRKKNILVLSTGKNVAPQPIEVVLNLSQFIQHTIIIGNHRKYVTALIALDFDFCHKYAQSKGTSFTHRAELLRSELIHSKIQREIDRLLSDFAPFEKPKKFRFLENELTIESGELTPKLSIKVRTIEKKYGHLIQAMYEEEPHHSEVAASTE
ncbi:long-chain fatty acid--CoA ligase [Hazenella sp. IB182357]|uniref:Long-chain fatty acid--CoA ligase n=1 Tax=Polycladospora coralii TaxID=2771432 RepID=A0A926NBE9_9BACL|nr:long-chain fatty acid--CoA ligase [Polycladospora coralii]MBD1373806.1 long-chain fatty acid--CoA ligase [Polycladospora coralii]MBS7531542.1 long-chain fatty acid--CoA ligase [Polycladospora coralii]